jgi:sulfur-oxidizing protein SoxY
MPNPRHALPTRRDALARSAAVLAMLASAGVLPARAQGAFAKAAFEKAAFENQSVDGVLRALGWAVPVESDEITFTAPDVAENGAAVPITATSRVAGAQRLAILVEKNPTTLIAVFDFTEAVEPSLKTRIKMDQTSRVLAVSLTADGRVLFAQKNVTVTLGGCGD